MDARRGDLECSAPNARTFSEDYWAVLAALRFLLALWVLFAHTRNFGTIPRAMPVPSPNALVAVYAFLAISGFSIHHSIAIAPVNYQLRRLARIVPAHLVSVAIALLAYAICGDVLFDGRGNPWPFPPLSKWIGCLLLLQAVLPVSIAVLFPSWSLSIEVLCYALAPVLRQATIAAPVALVSLSIALFYFRPMLSPLYIGSDTYCLSFGAMVWAWLSGWLAYQARGKLLWTLLLSLSTGVFAIAMDPLLKGVSNYFVWIATLLILWRGDGVRLRVGVQKVFRYLGDLSYPLYVVHYPVLFLLYNSVLRSNPDWNWGILHVAVALVASVLVLRFADRPGRAWMLRRSEERAANKILA